ncbi:MAG: Na+/H+ antiporter NhaA, partial [Deltaproteobacteria bacterium]|nr:Na+/H+ antiporter NhaA [Deltaproteobacteria bacterium]
MSGAKKKGGFLRNTIVFLIENSLFLVIGAVVGLVWANVNVESYHKVAHFLDFAINDVAMAFFFLLAGKEIREAMLPNGPLSKFKTAALPVMATIGGMAGPAIIYVAGVNLFNAPELHRGWAIPMATDIAFSYMVARMIFP